MAIWHMCNNKARKYFKFIIFNSLKVKIVTNDYLKRANQSIHLFNDGQKYLDAILNLFELAFIELSELSNWILEQY